MKHIPHYFLIFVLLLTAIRPLSGQSPLFHPVDSLLLASIHQTYSQQFDNAQQTVQHVRRKHPAHPVGPLFEAMTLQMKMLDQESDIETSRFIACLDTTIQLARICLNQNPESGWARFYLGTAAFYQAYAASRDGDWLDAYQYARRGQNQLKKAIEADSSITDAYFGLGNFYFWKSRKTRFFAWLPFVSNDEDQGMVCIKRALTDGHFTYFSAVNALAWNYIELKNYPAALRLAEIGLEHVPDSRFFLWIQAEAARLNQDWELANTVYQKIMGSYQQLLLNNHYNEAVCCLRLAEISWAQEEFETVWQYCERGLQLPLATDIAHRLQGNQKELMQLQAAALEKFHSIH